MSRTHTADGKRRASMAHAKHSHTCSLCGKVTRGNGGRASHRRKHIREAGLDPDDFDSLRKASIAADEILRKRGDYPEKTPVPAAPTCFVCEVEIEVGKHIHHIRYVAFGKDKGKKRDYCSAKCHSEGADTPTPKHSWPDAINFIHPGRLYRLAEDITNPLPDARRASPMFQSCFPGGSFWVARWGEEPDSKMMLLQSCSSIGLTGHHTTELFGYAVESEGKRVPVKKGRSRAWASSLVPHLVEVPIDNVAKLRSAFGTSLHTGVLKRLLKDGDVPLDRVIEILRELDPTMEDRD